MGRGGQGKQHASGHKDGKIQLVPSEQEETKFGGKLCV